MEKKCRFSYNDFDDTLAASCKEENENVRETFMFDNFIFSLTGKGKIVGIQIKNASKVLLESNVEPSMLPKLKEVSMIIIKKDSCLFIGISLSTEDCAAKIPIRVLMQNSELN